MSHYPYQFSSLPLFLNWADRPTTGFGESDSQLAVLPIHGPAEHFLGLPWNVEEVIAAPILARSLARFDQPPICVLPPLELSHAPYHAALCPADPDDMIGVLHKIAAGARLAGFRKLAFWSTHPWNTELIDVASRDIRIELGLQTFVVELSGLGLSLHPRSTDRAKVQRLASHLLQIQPETIEPSAEPIDTAFRPGNWSNYPPLTGESDEDPSQIAQLASQRLAGLWSEILAHSFLDGSPGISTELLPSPPDEVFRPTSDPWTRRQIRYLTRLTPNETRSLAQTNPLVIIPVGAIEQHGAHLPVGVDTMIAEASAYGLASRLDESVCVAPSLYFGKSNEHHDFTGTIDIGADLLRRLLKHRVCQLHELGFRQFAVLNTHGGNSSVLVYSLRELQQELAIRIGMLRLPGHADLSAQESTWGFHAGEWETSIMLYLAPELVDMDKAICHYPAQLDEPGELKPENAPAIYSWRSSDIAPGGVMGDATQATAEKGQRWFEFALDEVAASIRDLNEVDSRGRCGPPRHTVVGSDFPAASPSPAPVPYCGIESRP